MSLKEVRLYKTFVRLLLGLIVVCAVFQRCASIQAPQGGPLDSLSPRAIAMTPSYGMTNFTEKRIYIEFDEYVQIKDQQKEFYTSPFMEKKPTMTLKRRGVQIDFREDLEPDRTYALNFGSSIADNNEGNPLVGLRYVFSTGDVIDSMFMSGLVLDAYTRDTIGNTFIMYFDAALDTVPEYDSLMFSARAQTVGRALPNGIFITENLKAMPYRVYAFEDRNTNQTYDAGVDPVGFIDTIFDPTNMPGFDIWYDTLRMYMQADPQLVFNMFLDQVGKRQVMSSPTRPAKNKAILKFNAPNPIIDTLIFHGIDTFQIITEYLKHDKDSIAYWFTIPEEQLPDTIRGRIVYHRSDSVGILRLHGQDFRLGWGARVQTRREQRQVEEDPLPEPLKVNVDANNSINPANPIKFNFDIPLTKVNRDSITLHNITDADKEGVASYKFERDTFFLKEWFLSADWTGDERYRLTIYPGAFENIQGQRNDTLRAEFNIESPTSYAMLALNVTGKTPDSKYIIQIVDELGKRVLKEVKDVITGKYTLYYIQAGIIRIRVIEDLNGNGKWDTGALLTRRQPERVEMFVASEGKEEITTKVNWELEFDLNMNDIFAPVTMESLREIVSRFNEKYIQKEMERRVKRNQDLLDQQNTHGHDHSNDYQNSNTNSGALPFGGSGTSGFRQR